VKKLLIPAPPLLTIVPGQKPIVVLDIFIDIVGCANNVAIPLPIISKMKKDDPKQANPCGVQVAM
jgi:hypothetical protein